MFQGQFGKAVTSITENPQAVADVVNKYYKDTKFGEGINVTAESLTEGLDLSEGINSKKYSRSIPKALKNNRVLRTLAVLQVAGRMNMDAEAYGDTLLSGNAASSNSGGISQLVSNENVRNFLKQASPAKIEAVAEQLGIESFEDITPAQLAEKVEAFEKGEGAQRYRETRAKIKEALSIPESRARKQLPRNLRLQQGHTVRYVDGVADIAIMREGESFVFYDYKSNTPSKKLSREDANRALAEIRKAAQGGTESAEAVNTQTNPQNTQ